MNFSVNFPKPGGKVLIKAIIHSIYMIKNFANNLTFLFLLIFNYSNSQPTAVLPKDESAKDPGLSSMVNELKRIIKTKDFNALIKHIHPGIQIGFDGNNGKEAFKQEWSSTPNQSRLWSILKRIIDLGGVFIKEDPKNMFVFPYAYEVDLGNIEDAYKLFIVTAKNVNVRENPSLTAKVIGQLSYHVVTIDDAPINEEENEWKHIRKVDKKVQGFVHRDFLYSPSDYRMFLKREKDQWLIYMLLAGD